MSIIDVIGISVEVGLEVLNGDKTLVEGIKDVYEKTKDGMESEADD